MLEDLAVDAVSFGLLVVKVTTAPVCKSRPLSRVGDAQIKVADGRQCKRG